MMVRYVSGLDCPSWRFSESSQGIPGEGITGKIDTTVTPNKMERLLHIFQLNEYKHDSTFGRNIP